MGSLTLVVCEEFDESSDEADKRVATSTEQKLRREQADSTRARERNRIPATLVVFEKSHEPSASL